LTAIPQVETPVILKHSPPTLRAEFSLSRLLQLAKLSLQLCLRYCLP
jgi:hypothetical protein